MFLHHAGMRCIFHHQKVLPRMLQFRQEHRQVHWLVCLWLLLLQQGLQQNLHHYKTDEHFREIYKTDIVTRSEIRTDYLREKYHLNTNMLKCPLTNDPYIFEIDTTGDEDIFTVTSPLHLLEEPYTESRFGVFTFESGDHGFIKGTQKSWAE